MPKFPTFLILILTLNLFGIAPYGHAEPIAKVPPNKKFTGEKMEEQFPEILASLQDADVVLVGEEHDNLEGQKLALKLLEALSVHYPISLSLEMLEWNQQASVNEFLADSITEKAYLQDSQFWPNYQSAYHPMVRFAKQQGMPVVCANPPRKYTNKITREGILAFRDLDPNISSSLPPAQNILRDRSPLYEERLRNLFGSMHGSMGKSPSSLDNLILAQHTWDAGMADRILREHYRKDRKIFHVNGRFHSDYGLGLTYRLRKWGLRVKTLTIVSEKRWEEETKLPDPPIADFLILTK